jgi:hypothetical protein
VWMRNRNKMSFNDGGYHPPDAESGSVRKR